MTCRSCSLSAAAYCAVCFQRAEALARLREEELAVALLALRLTALACVVNIVATVVILVLWWRA